MHAGFALYSCSLKNKKVKLFEFNYKTNESPASDLDYDMDLTKIDGPVVSIKNLVIAFFVITSFAHVAYATDIFGRGGYYSNVFGQGWNPIRWFEYSITASIMIYIISIVAGAKEESTALVAALLTPGIMLQGLTVERELKQNQLAAYSAGLAPRPNVDNVLIWANFAPAWFFFGIKWFIIFNAYLKLKNDLKNESPSKTIDPKITQLVVSQFILFSLFGVVQSVQIYGWAFKGSWSSRQAYITFEKMYIGLSFVAKAALGLSVARLLN